MCACLCSGEVVFNQTSMTQDSKVCNNCRISLVPKDLKNDRLKVLSFIQVDSSNHSKSKSVQRVLAEKETFLLPKKNKKKKPATIYHWLQTLSMARCTVMPANAPLLPSAPLGDMKGGLGLKKRAMTHKDTKEGEG